MTVAADEGTMVDGTKVARDVTGAGQRIVPGQLWKRHVGHLTFVICACHGDDVRFLFTNDNRAFVGTVSWVRTYNDLLVDVP